MKDAACSWRTSTYLIDGVGEEDVLLAGDAEDEFHPLVLETAHQ